MLWVDNILNNPAFLSLNIGDIMLISMKDKTITGIKRKNDAPSGQSIAIPKPVRSVPIQNIEKITQLIIDGRPVQLLATMKRKMAFT